MVRYHLAKCGGHRYCSSRDMFLVCHAAKQEDMIKGRRDFNDINLSRYVITLPSYVVIGTGVVETYVFFVVVF